MTETIELAAETRTVIGKSAKKLGPEGRLPAVVYGVGHEPVSVSLDRHTVEQLLLHEGFTTAVVHLSIDGHKARNVIIKQVQRHPVKGTVSHIDFWAISMTQTIATTVQIHFVGESAGVKAGGVMTHNLRELHIEALPANLPENIEVDVSALEVGDSLHVSQVTAPEGVTITTPEDEIVCSVLAPKVEEEEAPEAEEAEPEVIGEKPESGE